MLPKFSSAPTPQSDPLEFLTRHPYVRTTVLDKIHGCIIGSALGDTMGLYTEFLSRAQCATHYPKRKFRLDKPVTRRFADAHRCNS
jgi:hypothetical protein